MRLNRRDLAAGALFMAIGAFFTLNAWFNLAVGSAFAMGPGYFPILLGLVLIGLGLAIALAGSRAPASPFGTVSFGAVSWRGVSLVTASILFFALTVRGLGMAPALGGATILAALSSDRNSPAFALVVSLCLTTASVLIFVYALRLPYPVIGPWLNG
jgi:hypothetical protein